MSENTTPFNPAKRDGRSLSERVLESLSIEPGLTISKLTSYLRESRTRVVSTVNSLVISHEIVSLNPDPTTKSLEPRYAKPADAEDMIVRGEAIRTEDWKPGETSRPVAPARSAPVPSPAPAPAAVPTPAPAPKAAPASKGFTPPTSPARPSTATFAKPPGPPKVEVEQAVVEVEAPKGELPAHTARRLAILADLKANPGTDSVACAARTGLTKQRVCGDLLVMRDANQVYSKRILGVPKKMFAWFEGPSPVEHVAPVPAPTPAPAPAVEVVKPVEPVVDQEHGYTNVPERGLAGVQRALGARTAKARPPTAPVVRETEPVDVAVESPAPAVAVVVEEPVQPVSAPELEPVVDLVAAPVEAPDRAGSEGDGFAAPDAPAPDPRAVIPEALDALIDDMIVDGWNAVRLIAGSQRGLTAVRKCERIVAALHQLELVRRGE